MKRTVSLFSAVIFGIGVMLAVSIDAAQHMVPGQMTPGEMQRYMQQQPGGYGMGPGMMGGGYGQGRGYGNGMMGGMMDMMMNGGGMGMGPGMMGGGYGMGPGMMDDGDWGMGPLNALALTDDQRDKIDKMRDAERKKHWDVAGKIMDAQNALRDLYLADEPDPKKVGAAYGNVAALQRQMIEMHVQTNNDIRKLLTAEQRDQLKQLRRGGYGSGMGPGMRGMPGSGMPGAGMMGR